LNGSASIRSVMSRNSPLEVYWGMKMTSAANTSGRFLAPAAAAIRGW
jgi:hypothetical protein